MKKVESKNNVKWFSLFLRINSEILLIKIQNLIILLADNMIIVDLIFCKNGVLVYIILFCLIPFWEKNKPKTTHITIEIQRTFNVNRK